MDTVTLQAKVWADLLTSELSAQSAIHQVTNRAEIYLTGGLIDLDQVLDALKISRATWYRRLTALHEHQAQGRADADAALATAASIHAARASESPEA